MPKVMTRGGKPLLSNGKVAITSSGECCGDCGGGTIVCCHSDGSCTQVTAEECLDSDGTVVDAPDCSDPDTCKGACCDAGVCSVETPDDCQAAGGAFIGYGTDCTGVNCFCCPWFTENNYTIIKLSGSIAGCPSGTITIPEQTWTLNNIDPAMLAANEFSLYGCTFNAASNCLGIVNAIGADQDGSCNNILAVDWAGLCTNEIALSGIVNNFLCGAAGCGAVGPTTFYLTGPTLAASLIEACPGGPLTYNFLLEFS